MASLAKAAHGLIFPKARGVWDLILGFNSLPSRKSLDYFPEDSTYILVHKAAYLSFLSTQSLTTVSSLFPKVQQFSFLNNSEQPGEATSTTHLIELVTLSPRRALKPLNPRNGLSLPPLDFSPFSYS